MSDNVIKFPKPAGNSTTHLTTTTDPYCRLAKLVDGKGFVWMDDDTDAALRFSNLEELLRFIEELMAVANVWNEARREA